MPGNTARLSKVLVSISARVAITRYSSVPPTSRTRNVSVTGIRPVAYRIAGIDQVLGTHDIERITGRHRCTIYRWVRSGTFPEKRAGGGRGWLKSDVERWLKGGSLSDGP
jgi:predicted DNA-binding transcriptional regulator AlpA